MPCAALASIPGRMHSPGHGSRQEEVDLICAPFVKSGTGASLGRSISVDPASPRLHVILLV